MSPSDGRLSEVTTSDSGGWLEESLLPLLPSIVFSLPYMALIDRPPERLAPVSVSQYQVEAAETHPAAL